MPSLREDLDKRDHGLPGKRWETGLSLHERIIELDRLHPKLQALGLNVVDMETEQSRLLR